MVNSDITEELLELIAYREREEKPEATRSDPDHREYEGPVFNERVSEKAIELIVEFETGGIKYYEKILGARPHWPGYQSGLTLGFGYDLGYKTELEFRSDWEVLGKENLDRLVSALGKHGGNTDSASLRTLEKQFADITIPWGMALENFSYVILPRYIQYTDGALPNTHLLNGDCFGALVSLTFNRGRYGYGLAGDRYKELREIKAELEAERLTRIPELFRSMIRVWKGSSIYKGMKRRREAEARLFEEGLQEISPENVFVSEYLDEEIQSAPRSGGIEDSTFSDEDYWTEETEEDVLQRAAEQTRSSTLFRSSTLSKVSWVKRDSDSFDYAHLESSLPQNVEFEFTSDDLALLCRLNSFPINELGDTPVLFGLRGASIYAGDASNDGVLRDRVFLQNIRPDHKNVRCILGIWNRDEGSVAVFPGSTVPNAKAVRTWKHGRKSGNILPTGMYRYACGTHNGRPGCFLLRYPDMRKRSVVVRRSSDNYTYEITDYVHKCLPGDNIHPTFSNAHNWFSSFGCQTVVGKAVKGSGQHSGPWANFRKAAGLTDANGEPGKQFLYVLLTGQEAMFASDLRRRNLHQDELALRGFQRLRFGSNGEQVKKLQRQLNISDDGDFGPGTASSLYNRQKAISNNRSDGIYSRRMDDALGWDVF